MLEKIEIYLVYEYSEEDLTHTVIAVFDNNEDATRLANEKLSDCPDGMCYHVESEYMNHEFGEITW